MVSASGRGNYEVTKSGIEWVLANAESLETYARHIRRDIQRVKAQGAIRIGVHRDRLQRHLRRPNAARKPRADSDPQPDDIEKI